MNLQRAELFKAVKALNWKGNCRALWKALDHDQSGITTIEEQLVQHKTACSCGWSSEWLQHAFELLSGGCPRCSTF
ncbi:unnamed protein product [Durusdinium trenchii]|uniref:EF-hand domain-containing protein n=1 Tax=Durusdinium trenchii TaxID=1381693 RepID=A0ABP0PNR5_9DINO